MAIKSASTFLESFLKLNKVQTLQKQNSNLNLKDLILPCLEQLIKSGESTNLDQTLNERVIRLLEKKTTKYLENLNKYLEALTQHHSKDVEKQSLYAVQLGGRVKGGWTEVHDVAIGIGRSIEECFPQFAQQWFGLKTTVHVDSSVHLKKLDQYEIRLVHQPIPSQELQVFFVNLGSYIKDLFGEFHRFGFVVAKKPAEAVAKATRKINQQYIGFPLEGKHLDDSKKVSLSVEEDDVKEVSENLLQGVHIAIDSILEQEVELKVNNAYLPIDFVEYKPANYCAEEDRESIGKIYQCWQSFLQLLRETPSEEALDHIEFSVT